jgi:hypothetical protein
VITHPLSVLLAFAAAAAALAFFLLLFGMLEKEGSCKEL